MEHNLCSNSQRGRDFFFPSLLCQIGAQTRVTRKFYWVWKSESNRFINELHPGLPGRITHITCGIGISDEKGMSDITFRCVFLSAWLCRSQKLIKDRATCNAPSDPNVDIFRKLCWANIVQLQWCVEPYFFSTARKRSQHGELAEAKSGKTKGFYGTSFIFCHVKMMITFLHEAIIVSVYWMHRNHDWNRRASNILAN